MISLYLLASHMVGDFIFQNRWHSERKLDDPLERAWHVLWYTLAFAPVVYITAPPVWKGAAFSGCLFVLHFLTDSRRFHSTLGDVLGWSFRREFSDQWEWDRGPAGEPINQRRVALLPNPWPAMPLMIDQTLHVVQIAVLGGLFLT